MPQHVELRLCAIGKWSARVSAPYDEMLGRCDELCVAAQVSVQGVVNSGVDRDHNHKLRCVQAMAGLHGGSRLAPHLLFSDRDFNENDYEALLALDEGIENRRGRRSMGPPSADPMQQQRWQNTDRCTSCQHWTSRHG